LKDYRRKDHPLRDHLDLLEANLTKHSQIPLSEPFTMGAGCSSDQSAAGAYINPNMDIPNFKVVLIGDPRVGKTNIIRRYAKCQFDYDYLPTVKVNIENTVRKLNVPVNAVVSLTIWDVPGHEDMDHRATYYKNVDAVLVITDLADADSVELAGAWRQDFISKASRTRQVTETLPSGVKTTKEERVKGFDPRSVPIILIGNKYDLVEEQMEVADMNAMLETNAEQEELTAVINEVLNDDKDEKSSDSDFNKDVDTEDITNEENQPDVPVEDKDPNEKSTCLRLLEQVEQEHGFTASIVVSAKSNDGSVDMMLQAIVRFLLCKSDINQLKGVTVTIKKKARKQKRAKVDKDELMSKVGVAEIDAIFDKCDIPVRRALDYHSFYEVALKQFKQNVADLGCLDKPQASLEDATIALRDYVRENLKRDLEISDEVGFIRLYIKNEATEEDTKLMKQHRPLNKLLEDFNSEYCGICQAIIRDCPTMDAVLSKLDSAIQKHTDRLNNLKNESNDAQTQIEKGHVTENVQDYERIIMQCEKNQARMAHSRLVITELLDTANTAARKIRAALLW